MTRFDFELRKPDDMHIHLRQGPNLKNYVEDCIPYFGKILVMPNTVPPISNAIILKKYKKQIQSFAPNMTPLMTFKLKASMGTEEIDILKKAGAVAGKLYPAGATTNSADGITDVKRIYALLEHMQAKDLVLSVHAEDPDAFCLDRESVYLEKIKDIADHFPKLKIIIEHLSCRQAVEYVQEAPEKIAATISVHHLLLTLNDILGASFNPHHFCKPIAKTPEDRKAIMQAAFSGNPKFFLGTDSAPHLKASKETAAGQAGIYTAPVAIPLLISIFEKAGKLEMLENFTSQFGSAFYELEQNQATISFKREDWSVPELMHGVVPFFAGKKISWKLAD
ncbi:MAG: dihydroorotase [Fibrobacteria bacterium]|nr:dihydroorotase [Fibrobacteria bacterium]